MVSYCVQFQKASIQIEVDARPVVNGGALYHAEVFILNQGEHRLLPVHFAEKRLELTALTELDAVDRTVAFLRAHLGDVVDAPKPCSELKLFQVEGDALHLEQVR